MRNVIFLVTTLFISLLFTACNPTPAKHEVAYSVPCNVATESHKKYDYYHIPPKVDTKGQAAAQPPAGSMLVGYDNDWEESGIGGVNHRYLGFAYRGFVFFDRAALPAKGLVLEAKLHFKTPDTVKWQGSTATNETASAAGKFYILTAPSSGFNSSGDLHVDLPNSPAVATNASFDAAGGLVVNVTSTVRDIVQGTRPNYGFMLVGVNESFQHNNDKFLSTYEAPLLKVRVLEDKPQWPTP